MTERKWNRWLLTFGVVLYWTFAAWNAWSVHEAANKYYGNFATGAAATHARDTALALSLGVLIQWGAAFLIIVPVCWILGWLLRRAQYAP